MCYKIGQTYLLPTGASRHCWDNAVMERFFGTLKSEWTDARRYATQREAIAGIAHFIEWE